MERDCATLSESEIHAKPSNIAELKTAKLLSVCNDLLKEFIDKAILSFWKRFDFRVLLELVDILNTTFSNREGS